MDTLYYHALPQVGEPARRVDLAMDGGLLGIGSMTTLVDAEAKTMFSSSATGASLAGLGSIWAPTIIGRVFQPRAAPWQ